jgi:hypothetical protein
MAGPVTLGAALLLLPRVAHADLIPPPPRERPDPRSVARKVAMACGDTQELQALAFTFVAEVDGAEKVRRRHAWDASEGTVRVTRGDGPPVTLRLRPTMPTTAADPAWASLAPGVAPAEAWSAWTAFVNDQYWLMAPCKVLDPGVVHSLDGADLVLTFAGVGLTPGDRYTLELDAESSSVRAWRYRLQSGAEGHDQWVDPVEAGPLRLFTRRESLSDSRVIRFEDVVGVRRVAP